MILANTNLSVTAAYMALVDHVKHDIEKLDKGNCLLALIHKKKFLTVATYPDQWGAYLHHNDSREAFVCAGKKTGEGGFAGRDAEHLNDASKAQAPSNFHRMYPFKRSTRANSQGTRGFYENLSHVIASGFNPTTNVAKLLDRNWTEGGLLIMSKDDKKNIRASD